jgi:hypothetical protein
VTEQPTTVVQQVPAPVQPRNDDATRAREALKKTLTRIESSSQVQNEVTPKELERMMRTTGSDKLP